MKVKVLGVGSAFTNNTNASIVINDNILIDCGPTVPSKLFSLNLKPKHIIITHPHGDHILGLPLYILKVCMDKDMRITFWSSPRVIEVIKILWENTYNWGSWEEWVEFRPVLYESGKFNIGNMEVEYQKRHHTSFTHSYAFKFGKLGYATDVSERFEDYEFYKGLNVLIHEFGPYPDHTPLDVVVKLALKAGIKRLYFIHYSDGAKEDILRDYIQHFDDIRLLKEGETLILD